MPWGERSGGYPDTHEDDGEASEGCNGVNLEQGVERMVDDDPAQGGANGYAQIGGETMQHEGLFPVFRWNQVRDERHGRGPIGLGGGGEKGDQGEQKVPGMDMGNEEQDSGLDSETPGQGEPVAKAIREPAAEGPRRQGPGTMEGQGRGRLPRAPPPNLNQEQGEEENDHRAHAVDERA